MVKLRGENGPVAQLAARLAGSQKVTGSTPVRSTSSPVVTSGRLDRHFMTDNVDRILDISSTGMRPESPIVIGISF